VRTGCIRHPAGARYLKIYEWQLEFCEGNQCAAALMSYFEYCHNWKLEQLEQAKKQNDELETSGKARTQNETLLQWHSAKELEQAVMLYKRDTIQKSIENVLVSKGALEVHKNPNPRLWFDHTKHFLFKPKTVNDWLAKHHPESEPAVPQSIDEKSEIPGETPLQGRPQSIDEKSETVEEKSSMGSEKSSSSIKEDSQRRQPKKTTTTPRAHVSAKGMRLVAEEVREVVVVSSVVVEEEPEEPSKEEYWPDEDESPVADQPPWPDDEAEREVEEAATVTEGQKAASAAVEAIATEFRLGVVGRGEIQHHLGLKGLAYVQEKATLTRSQPRNSPGGYFLAALKDDYQAPKSTAPAPKPKGPTEPAGWREGLRAVARSRYPGADPEAWSYWKNVPRSLQVEVLAELARPTAASAPPVATVPAKVDLEAMREAVRNVGKEAAA
jgi:hypothetical protein